MRRDAYRILAEKYSILCSENQDKQVPEPSIPFTQDELHILGGDLYGFKEIEGTNEVKRIPAAGEVETVTKQSEGTYVITIEDGRGVTKHMFNSLYSLIQSVSQIYKANKKLIELQTPYEKRVGYVMQSSIQ